MARPRKRETEKTDWSKYKKEKSPILLGEENSYAALALGKEVVRHTRRNPKYPWKQWFTEWEDGQSMKVIRLTMFKDFDVAPYTIRCMFRNRSVQPGYSKFVSMVSVSCYENRCPALVVVKVYRRNPEAENVLHRDRSG